MKTFSVSFEIALTTEVEAEDEEKAEQMVRDASDAQDLWRLIESAIGATEFTASAPYDDVEVEEIDRDGVPVVYEKENV